MAKPDWSKILWRVEVEDLEEYETMQDIWIAFMHCNRFKLHNAIFFMFGDMTRIEAAKRALEPFFLLNRKNIFPDSIYRSDLEPCIKSSSTRYPIYKRLKLAPDFPLHKLLSVAFRLQKNIAKDGALNSE